MSFTIEGIGTVPSNRAEYTSGSVLQKYSSNMTLLRDIFNNRTEILPSDFDYLVASLQTLRNLAINGSTDGDPPLTFYLTAEMAVNLDLVFKSLKAVGITPDSNIGISDEDKLLLLENWQSLAGFGVQAIMNAAASVSTNSTRTLQSMVELEYIKQGNDLLAQKFSALEESLRTTQGILDSLTIIQGISNQITVTNRGNFGFPPKNDSEIPSGAVAAIQAAMNKISTDYAGAAGPDLLAIMATFNAKFNQSISDATANATINGTTLSVELGKLHLASDVINAVINHDWSTAASKGTSVESLTIQFYTQIYKAMASSQFRQVFPVATPTSTAATELVAAKVKLYERLLNLEAISPLNSRSVEGSLANFIYKVTLDISNAFKNINISALSPTELATAMKAAVSKWILDNQDQKISSSVAVETGAIQDRITQAIKAAESLNDTEKENVRNYQFVFEQFYKSASAVLQKVTQIIEKMAQGIGR